MNNGLRRYGIWVIIALVGALCWGCWPSRGGDGQRRLALVCGAGLLRHSLQVLRPIHTEQGVRDG